MTDTDLGWLDLLPPGVAPTGVREAVTTYRAGRALYDARSANLATATATLAALAADPDANPHAAALDLLVAREVFAATPPATPVDQSYPDALAGGIRQWFADRPAALGVPPLILSELRHAEAMHRGERSPRPTDHELEVCEVFDATAKECFTRTAERDLLCEPLAPDPDAMTARAVGFLAFIPRWEELITLATKVRALVDAADAARLGSDALHRCPRWGGAHCGPLLSVEACYQLRSPQHSGRWTEAWALSQVDGRHVEAALTPVGVA